MTFPGGKNGAGVYQQIINLLPPHEVYIEAFLGSGAIMRLKRPAWSSIGIDVDADMIAVFPRDAVPNLCLLNTDALEYLRSAQGYHGLSTLVYLDPPYLLQTRRQQRQIYRYEFSREQHAELLEIANQLNCMVVISGYESEMYVEALKHWRTHTFVARTRGGTTATEWVWMNFPPPLELHDYRYLGQNFRERERIKRKKLRWRSRLERMPALERHALMATIEEIRSGGHAGNSDGAGGERDDLVASPEGAMSPAASLEVAVLQHR